MDCFCSLIPGTRPLLKVLWALAESLLLSRVVLNIRDWPEKNGVQNFGMSKIHLRVDFTQKSTKMHWYDYNNTVPLLKHGEKSNILSSM